MTVVYLYDGGLGEMDFYDGGLDDDGLPLTTEG